MTKYISEINFVSSAVQGDLFEMGLTATKFGRTSLTMRAEVRNMITRRSTLTIEEIVFVNLDTEGKREPHGYTEIAYEGETEFPPTTSRKRNTGRKRNCAGNGTVPTTVQ